MPNGMIERAHPSLSVGKQCRLLSISRSSFYYAPQGETEMNQALMQVIDQQFLETPFYGVRQMTWHLQNAGHSVNQKRIRRLMRLMRLMPIYQKPNTRKPAKGHKTYPYLLGGLRVDRPNQVWCADITYLPMRRGFLYLVAIMDWFTRKVFDGLTRPHRGHGPISPWRISNTLEADFCVEAHRSGPFQAGGHSLPQTLYRPRSLRDHHEAAQRDQPMPDRHLTLRRASRAASSPPSPGPTG